MKRLIHPVAAADAAQRNLLLEELAAGTKRPMRPDPGGPPFGVQRHGNPPVLRLQ